MHNMKVIIVNIKEARLWLALACSFSLTSLRARFVHKTLKPSSLTFLWKETYLSYLYSEQFKIPANFHEWGSQVQEGWIIGVMTQEGCIQGWDRAERTHQHHSHGYAELCSDENPKKTRSRDSALSLEKLWSEKWKESCCLGGRLWLWLMWGKAGKKATWCYRNFYDAPKVSFA